MNLLEKHLQSRAWDEEERSVIAQVQRMTDEVIATNAEHTDETGEFPWANVRAINDLGLNAIFIPEEFGGCRCRAVSTSNSSR